MSGTAYNGTAMRHPRRLLILALLSASPTFHLSAQDPADRRVIEGLRDSLGAVTDSTTLLRLEARTIDVAKHDRDNALIHLRLGFVAYRLGELANSKKHYDDAAGEIQWATGLRPDWPYPWYGLGLAELAQGEHSVLAIENLRQQLGKVYLSKAAAAFARAVQADPAFARATIDLATTALTPRIPARLQVVLEAGRPPAGAPGRGGPPPALPPRAGGGRGGGARGGGGAGRPGRASRGAFPRLFFRLAHLPPRPPPPPLRHHRGVPLRPAGIRRPRHHLPAPRRAGPARVFYRRGDGGGR